MSEIWILTIAVFAPLLAGLVTLLFPKSWILPRVGMAGLGMLLAFVLVMNQGMTPHPLAPSHDGHDSHDSHTAHVEHAEHNESLDDTEQEEHHHLDDSHTVEHHEDSTDSHADEYLAEESIETSVEENATAHAVEHHASDIDEADSIAWISSLHIDVGFFVDGLGGFFALLVSGIGFLIVLYARAYFGKDAPEIARFYPTLGFFTTAMIGVALSDYLLLTLLFWEMTSISSFLLIGWNRFDKVPVKLAMQAFFTTGLGGMALFGGLLVLGNETGFWRWSELMTALANGSIGWDLSLSASNPLMWAFVLMLIGGGMKSAQFPFHYWLPGAMAAPTPVSAFLHSATMVKAGVFLLGRLFPILGMAGSAGALELWPMVIIPLGGVTMVYGAILAIQQHDLKRIFAYSTVSQLGLLVCMYGLGGLSYHDSPVIDFDITQIANHAFYKAPLFIVAGALGHVASRNITELHGAWKNHKAMVIVMIAAGYALAALPGSISFQAKELFLYGVLHSQESIGLWAWALMAATIVTAVCNVAIFIRLTTTLLGLPGSMGKAQDENDHAHDAHGHGRGHDEHAHETGLWAAMLWIPAAVLVSFQFIGGIITPLWNMVFAPVEQMASGNYIGHHYHGVPNLWQVITHPGLPLLMSVIAVAGGVALGYSKLLRQAIVDWADKIYPALYWLAVTGGGRVFRLVQTGYLRHYLIWVISFLAVCFAGAVWMEPAMAQAVLPHAERAFEYWPGIGLGMIVCAAAIMLPGTESRIVRVLLLGVCGFTVVGIYVVYKAPDLVLTQLMVEIISVFLFLLVLRLLPKSIHGKPVGRIWRGFLGLSAGIVMAWMTLVSAPVDPADDPDAERLGAALMQASYEPHLDPDEGYIVEDDRGGGGKNVVNVILVDFRGFDTLGEITVLSLAAMGVWSLIPRRKRRRANEASEPEANLSPTMTGGDV